MPFDTQNTSYQFGLDHKQFINFGKQARGNVDALIPISEGIQRIQQLESDWKMIDTPKPISMGHINFTGAQPTFQFRNKTGVGNVCNITRHALKQLGNYIQQKGMSGRNVNPYQLTEALCIQDEEYRQIATVAWSKMMGNIDKEVLFRSKLIDGVRTITSIQSLSYAPIRDSELLLKLKSENPNLYFVGAFMSSISSNYRLIENVDKLELNVPVPMYDIHNSDGGLRELVAFLKHWILLCTNGYTTTSEKARFNNRHYGDRDIIVGRFGEAIEEFNTLDDGFIKQYEQARTTEISSLWETMTYRLEGKLSKEQMEFANIAYNSNLIASERGTLGHAIDTLTLSAQAEKDPFQRHQLEVNATKFMEDIFTDLEKGKELIPATVLEDMSI